MPGDAVASAAAPRRRRARCGTPRPRPSAVGRRHLRPRRADADRAGCARADRALLRARRAPGGRARRRASAPARSRARPATCSCESRGPAAACSFGWALGRVHVDGGRRRRRAPRRRSGRRRRARPAPGERTMRDIFRPRRMWRRRGELKRLLRRRDRRRRLARPRDRLLPRRSSAITQRRRAREALHRLRRRGAQHDDPALELQDARGRALLRRERQALRGPVGGARLQPAVLAVRPPHAGALATARCS